MTSLSDAIATAHIERAKQRARAWAARFGVTVYIYSTRHGLELDTSAPMVADYFWSVSPSGDVAKIKRKGI